MNINVIICLSCLAVVQIFILLILNALIYAGWGGQHIKSMTALFFNHYFGPINNGPSRFWMVLCAITVFVISVTCYQCWCWHHVDSFCSLVRAKDKIAEGIKTDPNIEYMQYNTGDKK